MSKVFLMEKFALLTRFYNIFNWLSAKMTTSLIKFFVSCQSAHNANPIQASFQAHHKVNSMETGDSSI